MSRLLRSAAARLLQAQQACCAGSQGPCSTSGRAVEALGASCLAPHSCQVIAEHHNSLLQRLAGLQSNAYFATVPFGRLQLSRHVIRTHISAPSVQAITSRRGCGSLRRLYSSSGLSQGHSSISGPGCNNISSSSRRRSSILQRLSAWPGGANTPQVLRLHVAGSGGMDSSGHQLQQLRGLLGKPVNVVKVNYQDHNKVKPKKTKIKTRR